MSPRLLRPIASGVHPEAAAWRSAVVANGGSVSASTVKAVSTFCAAIDAASLRDRFYRLNLFAGTGLNAALVPLYRGPTYGGTTYGNTTDTNNGPFVSVDYVETGASGGLKGNGTSKYLDTGFTPDDFASQTSVHLSMSGTSLETASNPNNSTGDRFAVGSFNGPDGTLYDLSIAAYYPPADQRASRMSSFTRAGFSATGRASESLLVGSRTGSNLLTLYADKTSVGTDLAGVTASGSTRPFFVFALNLSGTAGVFTAARLRAYSIGSGLTSSQVAAFTDAVSDFHTALGRS